MHIVWSIIRIIQERRNLFALPRDQQLVHEHSCAVYHTKECHNYEIAFKSSIILDILRWHTFLCKCINRPSAIKNTTEINIFYIHLYSLQFIFKPAILFLQFANDVIFLLYANYMKKKIPTTIERINEKSWS